MGKKGKKTKALEESGLTPAQLEAQKEELKAAKRNNEAMSAAGEVVDDVMEGFAEMYRQGAAAFQGTASCIKVSVFPLKEYFAGAYTTGGGEGTGDVDTAAQDGQALDQC